jgi:adenylate cyclase
MDDGMLVEFGSAVDAVTCAMAVQEKMAVRTAEGTGSHIQFRVSVYGRSPNAWPK